MILVTPTALKVDGIRPWTTLTPRRPVPGKPSRDNKSGRLPWTQRTPCDWNSAGRMILLWMVAIELTLASNDLVNNTPMLYIQTWTIRNGQTSELWNSTTRVAPLFTWFPDLYFNLERIEGGLEKLAELHKWKARQTIRSNGFFICPAYKRGAWRQKCGGFESLFCASWDCVVANDGQWKWNVKPDLITMNFVAPYSRTEVYADSNLVKISFTQEGRQDIRW